MTTLSSQTPLDTTAPNVALAKYVDLGKWEHNNETEYRWQGQLALSQFPRLWALRDPNHDNDQPLQVNLTIEKRGNILHWHLQTDGDFWQTCQRCLEPVATDLYIDSEFALLENESQVALLPEGTEVILLDEITEDNKLWLLPMIEDELLVDLPLAPKHDDCEMAVTQVGELPEVEQEQENPFAMLASLKGRLSS